MAKRPNDARGEGGGRADRSDRLKAALKANIARRKAQARLRADGASEARDTSTGPSQDPGQQG